MPRFEVRRQRFLEEFGGLLGLRVASSTLLKALRSLRGLSIAYLAAIFVALLAMGVFPAAAKNVRVDSVRGLSQAIKQARAGDMITLAPGKYALRHKIKTVSPGSADRPIIVRAETLGTVLITSNSAIAFHISEPYWIFENLDIEGVCKHHRTCEHAFQITGNAVAATIRNNRLHEFNAMIKLNLGKVRKKGTKEIIRAFPADVLIEGNAVFNSTPRNTTTPVSLINLDGGRRHVVRGNLIADFSKAAGNKVAYGAFMKALVRGGVFEQNLVICELTHSGTERVGLSFGGGGSPLKIREEPVGDYEALDGILRNNIIMNCPESVSIYLNRSGNTKIYNNTIYNSFGIDVRFKESTADIRNNIMSGAIRERDGGTSTESNNLIFGVAFGANYPGGAKYLTRRLEGQDVKYPSLVDKSDVEFAQSLVRKAKEFVSPTWLGHGTNNLKSLFANPDAYDFSLREPDDIVDQGVVLKEVRRDFCGNSRNLPPHDIGAIEYKGEGCDVGAFFRQRR